MTLERRAGYRPADAGSNKALGRDGTAASTRSCGACSPPSSVARPYRSVKSRSSPCSDTKVNRRIHRCPARGRSACRSAWRLITATHKLLELYGHHTAAALA
jgi:hypothetical protein